MTLARGLGQRAIGACLAAGRAAGLFKPGSHGSTFGGNPLAMHGGPDHAAGHRGRGD